MFTLLSATFFSICGFFHVFSYTTARCGIGMLFSFFFVMFAMPKYIAYCDRWQGTGQPIRDNYLPDHSKKRGTPTTAGVLIILSVVLTCILFANLKSIYILILLFSLVSFGIVGFIDDYCKIRRESIAGMRGRVKFVCQVVLSFAVVFVVDRYMNSHFYSSMLTFPFFKKVAIDIGFFYVLFRVFVIVGASNAVNLTDGLDGLVTIPLIIANATFIVFAYVIGNVVFSKYLFFDYQCGAQEMCVFLSTVIGALMGFLWYNVKPARIFMGDSGSLALGGTIGTVAVLLKSEFLLAIVGGLFVVETVSVMLQVSFFKLTHGKRLFRMTPIHHHFEKCGWSETQVVVRFWIVSIIFALIGLSSLKIR